MLELVDKDQMHLVVHLVDGNSNIQAYDEVDYLEQLVIGEVVGCCYI